jgi:ATP-dependent Lon protease
MKMDQFLLRSEDEMDFLPIIPLNENDQEDLDGIEVPAEISLLPLTRCYFRGLYYP